VRLCGFESKAGKRKRSEAEEREKEEDREKERDAGGADVPILESRIREEVHGVKEKGMEG
jgi:hypothetical protein